MYLVISLSVIKKLTYYYVPYFYKLPISHYLTLELRNKRNILANRIILFTYLKSCGTVNPAYVATYYYAYYIVYP